MIQMWDYADTNSFVGASYHADADADADAESHEFLRDDDRGPPLCQS